MQLPNYTVLIAPESSPNHPANASGEGALFLWMGEEIQSASKMVKAEYEEEEGNHPSLLQVKFCHITESQNH